MKKEVKWNFLIKPYFKMMEEVEPIENAIELYKEGLTHITDEKIGDNIFFTSEDVPLKLIQEAYDKYVWEDQYEHETDGFKFKFNKREEEYIEPDLPDNYPEEEPEY